jgi:hypothetical protein
LKIMPGLLALSASLTGFYQRRQSTAGHGES